MKILLYIVTAILVITAAGSGYFISNLNGQIDNLQTELAKSTGDISSKIEQAGSLLEEKIQSGDSVLSSAIQSTNASLAQLSDTTGARFTKVGIDINSNTNKVNRLEDRTGASEAVIAGSLLQTTALYADAKQAIVRITDGTSLIGSGFIIAGTPGYNSGTLRKVVTAYHVVKDQPVLYVTLYDGRSFKARVWASSEASDVAIVTYANPDSFGLPDLTTARALVLADSWEVKGGDPVFVIGSPGNDTDPLGLADTVTAGIVSQVRRGEIVGDKYVTNLLQIDAAVNFGNSGGPLFNIKGEVIGIVIARVDPTLGDGISFAASSNMIKKVEKNIIVGVPGEFKYDYPWLGVGTNDLTPEYITENGNTITRGAEVINVTGPAEIAGVRVGDVIMAINGQPLRDSGELSSWVAEYGASGKVVTLTVIRNGVAMEITATLGVRP